MSHISDWELTPQPVRHPPTRLKGATIPYPPRFALLCLRTFFIFKTSNNLCNTPCHAFLSSDPLHFASLWEIPQPLFSHTLIVHRLD